MNFRKQFIIVGLALFALVVIADGLLTRPEESWFRSTWDQSRAVDPSAPTGAVDMDEIRRAARAQWDLAEWHYNRGEWKDAEREYLRLIELFPYIELDYGYRTDDARKRLLDVRSRMSEETADSRALTAPPG